MKIIYCLCAITFITACVSVSNNTTEKEFYWIEYTVKSGDTLTSISTQFNISAQTILALNTAKTIKIGETFRIPSIDGIIYTVTAGDSISLIGEKYSISREIIILANNLQNRINIGDKLFLPGAETN
ncbi:MAG: LysM peptidoglycan-binding domain-containing protein [Treponema sp.]|nr:LysM peptidoglycan-binding domain-containing protein [Treponema sp.]